MKKDLKDLIKAYLVKKNEYGHIWCVEIQFVSKAYFTRWNFDVDEERNKRVELIDEKEAIKRGLNVL